MVLQNLVASYIVAVDLAALRRLPCAAVTKVGAHSAAPPSALTGIAAALTGAGAEVVGSGGGGPRGGCNASLLGSGVVVGVGGELHYGVARVVVSRHARHKRKKGKTQWLHFQLAIERACHRWPRVAALFLFSSHCGLLGCAVHLPCPIVDWRP